MPTSFLITLKQVRTIIFLFIILVSVCCSKDDSMPTPNKTFIGKLSNAGLIKNFELYEPGENTIYIDPTNKNDANADGSIEHPFDSFEKLKWIDGSTYALKRGTTYDGPSIAIFADNVTICSYGKGDRPLLYCTDKTTDAGNRHAIISDWNGIKNLLIRDIEITAPEANSCIRILSNCDGVKIINCKVHDSYWGIRSIGNKNLTIHNTEVYNTRDDGMFIQYNEHIEISNCYVHHVNTNWQSPSTPESEAAGDGIQFDACNFWHVHHNKIDRTNSGNKFCFISNNADQKDGVLEYNVLTGPTWNGLTTYFHNGTGIIIRYNYMGNSSGGPVYTHGSDFLIHHNIFDNLNSPLYASKSAKVYNNLFYNMQECISGGSFDVSNNIFDIREANTPFKINTLSGSNNIFSKGKPSEGSFDGTLIYASEKDKDFHLSQNSDGIDLGIILGLKNDLDGTKIPQGKGPDIGPYEYIEN